MRTIGTAMPIDRVLRRRGKRGCPNEHPGPFEPPDPPAQDCIDPDFDAIDVDELLHDLAVAPARSIGDDED
jgi:hypothetical protein